MARHVPLSLREGTHGILKALSVQLDKSMAALIHEGALMLQAKYAAKASAPDEVPQHRSIDTGKSRSDYPTAA